MTQAKTAEQVFKMNQGLDARTQQTMTGTQLDDELIKVDRKVKLKEISMKLDIPKTNVYEIVHDKLGYRKVYHKRQRVEISQILLHRCQQEGDETVDVGPGGDHRARNKLLEHLITEDETWLHLSTPETKRDSMTWKHPSSIGNKSDGHRVLGLTWNDPFRYSAKRRDCQC
ncbi:histone-lysine N-methyltransferase SETMAR [Plakobranchus ocellatus]|uniref:Histone-lysine N-methyltransferase SETMAR n=1 Tax=Plakobranchus ocellatus TaxID=259542 RepID=A0AAV4A3A0_9GAST|nr:histone-lysine N-methyltransferase SETMAR [Plakobranchus ocellatus]